VQINWKNKSADNFLLSFVSLHLKGPLVLSILTVTGKDHPILEELQNITFRENSFGGSRVISCVQVDGRSDFNSCSPGMRMSLKESIALLKLPIHEND
jgi:hypothetical protein